MSDRGVCPSCGAPVDAWAPVIHEGEVYNDGLATWRNDDTVIGWDLAPCGHRARYVGWSSAGGHRFHNGPVR